jgi:hypothetical protein
MALAFSLIALFVVKYQEWKQNKETKKEVK